MSSIGQENEFLDGFDRRTFTFNFISWAISTVVFTGLILHVGRKGEFQFIWFFDFFAARNFWDHKWGNAHYEKVLPAMFVLLGVLMAYPFILMIFWGVTASIRVNIVYGLTVILNLPSLVIGFYTFMSWRSNSYRITHQTMGGFLVASILVITYELFIVFLANFDFVGISAVFLGFSILPMITLVYRLAFGETTPFESYTTTCNSLADDWLYGEDVIMAETKDGEGKDRSKLQSIGEEKAKEEDRSGKDVVVIVKAKDDDKNDIEASNTSRKIGPEVNKYNIINLGLFLTSFIILMVYGIIVAVLANDTRDRPVAFITAGAVLTVDLALISGVFTRKPIWTVGIMIVTRILLVIFGDRFYFIGHSIVYIFLAIPLGVTSVNNLLPPAARKAQLKSFLARLGFPEGSQALHNLKKKHVEHFERFGKFTTTKVGEWVIKHVSFVTLCCVTLLFTLDIALAASIANSRVRFTEGTREYEQWVLGILALLFSAYTVATFATWRVFANAEYYLTLPLILTTAIKNACLAVSGILVFLAARSPLALNIFIYFPWIVDLFILYAVKWSQADYVSIQAPEFRSPPFAPFWWAVFRGRLPLQDYFLNSVGLTWFIVVGATGLTIGLTDEDAFLGFAIPLVIYSVTFTLKPMAQWFYTLEVFWTMWIDLIIAFISHFLFTILLYTITLGKQNDLGSLGLLFYFLMFPSLGVLVFAAFKLKDDHEINSQFHSKDGGIGAFWPLVLGFNLTMFLVFLILAAVFFFSIIVGLALIGVYLLFLLANIPKDFLQTIFGEKVAEKLVSCSSAFFGATSRFAVTFDAYIYLLVTLIAIAFAVGVGISTDNAFLTFTFLMAFLFVVLIVSTFNDFKDDFSSKRLTYLTSPNVFPVFTVKVASRIEPDNERIYAIYLECLLAFLWGIIAVYFFVVWIGLGVIAVAIAVAYLITVNFQFRTLVILRTAVDYLFEVEEKSLAEKLIRNSQISAFKEHVSDERRPIVDKHKSTIGDILRKIKGIPNRIFGSHSSFGGSKGSLTEGTHPQQSEEKLRSGRSSSIGSADMKYAMFDTKLPGNDTFQEFDDQQTFNATMADEGVKTWQDAQAKKKLILSRIPGLSWTLPFGPGVPKNQLVEWKEKGQTKRLTRAQACRRALSFHTYERIRYSLYSRFVVQSIVNLHSRAEGQRDTTNSLMVNMLQERGIDMDAETFAALDPFSIEALAIKKAFKKYKLDRKRRQENNNREKDDIVKMDAEVARRIELNRKKREEREKKEREEAEKIERQKDLERAGNIEKLEAERKRQEEESKRLILEQEAAMEQLRKKREEEERLLQEQKEKAEEVERLRLEEEFRKRQILLKQQQEEKERRDQQAREAAKRKRNAIEQRLLALERERKAREEEEKSRQEMLKRQLRRAQRNLYGKIPDVKAGNEDPTIDPTEARMREWKGTKDHDFHGDHALFINPSKPKNKRWKKFKWAKWSDHLEKKGKRANLFVDDLDPGDIRQGMLGDCWFLSAIAVLCQHRKRLEKLFVNKDCKRGVYTLKFYKNDEVKLVTVDDRFPISGGTWVRPVFARSEDDSEMWVMILEKAYAKLHTCYEAIEAGFVDQALVDMTNGVSTRYDMTKEATKQKINDGSLWQTLLAYHRQGFLMGAGTPAGADSEANASYWGIVQGHAYSILDLFILDSDSNINLIKLRNPWGRKEWTGDWSDNSDKWTRRYRALVERRQGGKFVVADDGAFWMSFTDFAIHFEDIYICRFFEPEQGWIAKEPFYGQWDETNDGGCTNFETVVKSPQFLLKCYETTTIVLNLSQEEVRGKFDSKGNQMKKAAISIEIYQNKGRRVSRRRSGKKLASNPRSYVFTREVTAQATLPKYVRKGVLTPFTILISTFHQKVHRKFTLKIYSNKKIDVESLPPPEAA